MENYVSQLVTALGSPVVGVVAGFIFTKTDCTTIPGGSLGGYSYSSHQMCTSVFNPTVGITLTVIGWAIAIVWAIAASPGQKSPTNPPTAG
jgi:hypothetical protein